MSHMGLHRINQAFEKGDYGVRKLHAHINKLKSEGAGNLLPGVKIKIQSFLC